MKQLLRSGRTLGTVKIYAFEFLWVVVVVYSGLPIQILGAHSGGGDASEGQGSDQWDWEVIRNKIIRALLQG